MALVVKIGADMKKFEKEMKKLTREVKTVGEKFKDAGSALTKGLTVPIVAMGTASAKAAIDFETAFAGVRKTIDATEEEYAKLRDGILEMSKRLPAAVEEIAAVAEAAGQLGIAKENVLKFTETMINLGEATNLTAEMAATQLSRFANITGMSQKDFDRLGSSLVALGNNFATTEAEITNMAMRLAGQGAQIGMTQAEILALATAMSSVGIEAEMGGSAMSTVLKKIQTAVHAGGTELELFAKAAGMTSEEFKQTFQKNAIKALDALIKGLAKSGKEGKNLTAILQDLGIKGIRETDTMLRLVGASDMLSEAVELSTKAWEENTALTNEVEQRYKTTASQLKILWNRIKNVAITIGDALLPVIQRVVEWITPFVEKAQVLAERFKELSPPLQNFIFGIAAFLAAIGPVLTILGSIIIFAGMLKAALVILGTNLLGIIAPIALIVGAIVGLIAAFTLFRDEILAFWNETIKPVFNQVVEVIKENLQPAFETAFTVIKTVVKDAFEIIVRLWNEVLKPVFDFLVGYFEKYILPRWAFFFGTIGGVVEVAFRTIGDLWSKTLKPILNGIIDFVTGIFSADWEKAWKGVTEIFGGIWEGLKTLAKTPLNAVIALINGAIAGINKLNIEIPEWVPGFGGKKLGFNIPKIPYLATGGTLSGSGLAVVGEAGPELIQKSGSNVKVTPLTDKERQQGTRQTQDNRPIYLVMDKRIVAEILKEPITQLQEFDKSRVRLFRGEFA